MVTPVSFQGAYSSTDWDTLQQVFFNWVAGAAGLPETSIEWAGQDAPRAQSPAIEIRVSNIDTIGRYTSRREDNILTFNTLTVTAVDTTANTLAIANHGLLTGDGPVNVASTGTLPAPLLASTNYWIIVVDSGHIQLASTYTNTGGGQGAGNPTTAIDLTTVGSGTITVFNTPDCVRAGQELIVKSMAYLRMTLELHAHTVAAVGSAMAQAVLQKVVASQRLPAQEATLLNANVGLLECERVRAVIGVRDAALFEPRGYLDVHFCVPAEEEAMITFIQRAQITDQFSGREFTVGNP